MDIPILKKTYGIGIENRTSLDFTFTCIISNHYSMKIATVSPLADFTSTI